MSLLQGKTVSADMDNHYAGSHPDSVRNMDLPPTSLPISGENPFSTLVCHGCRPLHSLTPQIDPVLPALDKSYHTRSVKRIAIVNKIERHRLSVIHFTVVVISSQNVT